MTLKIAALQMVSTPDVERNLSAAGALIAEAAAAGAALVSLPEYFCLLGRRDSDKLAVAEAPGHGRIQQFLASAAQEHRVAIIGGTLPIRSAAAAVESAAEGAAPATARVLNRCCVFGSDGRELTHYDKLHLFAYDNGRESYDEGRTLNAGSTPCAVDITLDSNSVLRLGLSICYDLRFPELYRALMRPPCDLVAVPSAFTYTTGRAHWEVLLRARAIENQCYVLAAAQGGTHENGRRTFGHSMVVSPWGEVLACREEGAGVVMAELDFARIAEVRKQLPALGHRRL